MAVQSSLQPISIFWRLCIYGHLGFAAEVGFTAAWEFVVNLNMRFPGNTSLWSFFIYGLFGLVAEKIREFMLSCHIPLLIRAFVFMIAAFAWEFSCGMILKPLGFNAWDYSAFDYNIMGIITLEYAPAWYFGCLVGDAIFIPYINQLYWGPEPERRTKQAMQENTELNGEVKQKSY